MHRKIHFRRQVQGESERIERIMRPVQPDEDPRTIPGQRSLRLSGRFFKSDLIHDLHLVRPSRAGWVLSDHILTGKETPARDERPIGRHGATAIAAPRAVMGEVTTADGEREQISIEVMRQIIESAEGEYR